MITTTLKRIFQKGFARACVWAFIAWGVITYTLRFMGYGGLFTLIFEYRKEPVYYVTHDYCEMRDILEGLSHRGCLIPYYMNENGDSITAEYIYNDFYGSAKLKVPIDGDTGIVAISFDNLNWKTKIIIYSLTYSKNDGMHNVWKGNITENQRLIRAFEKQYLNELCGHKIYWKPF